MTNKHSFNTHLLKFSPPLRPLWLNKNPIYMAAHFPTLKVDHIKNLNARLF